MSHEGRVLPLPPQGAYTAFRSRQPIPGIHGIPMKTCFLIPFLGLPALSACRKDDAADFTVSVVLNEVNPNVVALDWTTDAPGVSWVEFGADTSYGSATPPGHAEETAHHVSLFGVQPLSTVHWRAVTETASGTLEATGSVLVGNVPVDLPGLEVLVSDPSRYSSEKYFLGSIVGNRAQLFIADREGTPLWYWDVNADYGGDNVLMSRVDFRRDSREILYETYTWDLDPQYSGLHQVTLEGERVSSTPVANCHHGFTERGDGAILVHVADIRPWYDEEEDLTVDVCGDVILQVFPDGRQEQLFNAWDWEPVTKTWRSSAASQYGDALDWTHANGIEWFASDDTILYSMGHLARILEMDATTGEILRTFGDGGIEVLPPNLPFEFQHSPNWTPEGNLVMTTDPARGQIMAVEYDVAPEGLSEVWSYGKDESFDSLAAGEVLRLANGNTLFNVGTTGTILEITPDGDVVWSLVVDLGEAFTWIRPFDSFYLE